MDRRPKIAREIAQDIAAYLREHFGLFVSNDNIEQWVPMITSRMVPHSIEFPKGEHVSTDDPGVVQQFRDKYPALERLIALSQAEALKRWPEATFTFEVFSDPESSHICSEGQHLTMKIMTKLPFSTEDGSPYWSAREAWMDFICGEGPYDTLERELGEVARLFRTEVEYDRSTE